MQVEGDVLNRQCLDILTQQRCCRNDCGANLFMRLLCPASFNPPAPASQPPLCAGNPRLCFVGGMDYEVLCGEWGGNKASRLGGGNRAANATHTGLKTGPAAAAEGAAAGTAAAGCARGA